MSLPTAWWRRLRIRQSIHKFPVLVRFAGVNDTAGREVFTQAGMEYYGEEITMTYGRPKMVEKMKQAYPGAPRQSAQRARTRKRSHAAASGRCEWES